jgi:hypothetical protein
MEQQLMAVLVMKAQAAAAEKFRQSMAGRSVTGRSMGKSMNFGLHLPANSPLGTEEAEELLATWLGAFPELGGYLKDPAAATVKYGQADWSALETRVLDYAKRDAASTERLYKQTNEELQGKGGKAQEAGRPSLSAAMAWAYSDMAGKEVRAGD